MTVIANHMWAANSLGQERVPRRVTQFHRSSTMHKDLYPVPENFATSAQVKRGEYEAMYAESIEDPDRFWGTRRPPHRLDQAVHARSRTRATRKTMSRPLVLRRQTQRRGQLPGPASRDPRRQDRDHLGRRRSGRVRAHQLPRAARARLPLRECAQGARRQKGRPRHDLSADDSGNRRRDAGLRAHRGDPLDRIRAAFPPKRSAAASPIANRRS